MCDCFHLAFPNWHAASGTGAGGRRLRGPEPGTEDDSVCDEPPQFTEGERPRPQGSSPVEEFPEADKFTDSDKECEAEHDPRHKSGTGKKRKKSGLGSMFEKRSTPKMSKLKELPSPESGVIVKTAKDGCAEGLIYGGGGKEGLFIKEVVPESPASKSLKLKEGDQVLSATVYFDNVPYEDAIQILEHAQAYKVKLCLKRKPDITETEPAMDSDVIPEDEVCAPEMREQGKTKRRGDARISWPKFPSFGKGRKSRFTRSHSSSEADEQRKLELSPTTSDTESPIKSQDALKGKKRHKMKLSVLTKRGRISSSEDQDTEVPTTGQTSDDIQQTVSDMLSPECLESLSGQTPEVFVTEDLRVVEEIRLEQSDQRLMEPVQHKVELISIDSTLKTEDLTVALAAQGSPPGIKSPKEKKSKKERSQLKMKILGKEKSHKKDAKAKGSPKRLKTLGASIEAADQPGNEKSDAIPGSDSQTQLQGDNLLLDINTSGESQLAKSATTQKEISIPTVDFDISSTFMRKSQKQEQAKKDDTKQKQEIKTCPTFKLPKIGFSDIATEETVQIVNVEERPTKMKHKSEDPAVKDDPYDILSKSSQLPKREDIEIPGMEDMAVRTKAKGIKEPKVGSRGHYEEINADAVQMLIDVNSVKEAVSKLPGFKLPKVDTSGVPIPEEITVIDANAQRISVKTPTKVADTKSKYGGHLMKVDITASPEMKLPKITPAASTSEDLLIETNVDFKTPEQVYKREDIIIPGRESEQGTMGITFENQSAAMSSPKESSKKSSNLKITTASFKITPVMKVAEIGSDFTKQNNFQEGDAMLGRRTIVLQDETPKTGKGQIGGVVSDVKITDIDSIEYIDSVSGSSAKMGVGINLTGFGVHLDTTKPKTDIEVEAEVKLPDAPEVDFTLKGPDVSIAEQDLEIEKPELEIKQAEVELDGQGSKFKMPKFGIKMPKVKGPELDLSLQKKEVDVKLQEAKADVKLPDATEVSVTVESADVSIPGGKLKVEKPELEIKPLQTDVEFDGQRSKFKMPKFGIKMPKVKGPELDLSLQKKEVDVKLPKAKAEVKLPEAPEVGMTLGSFEVSIPEQRMEIDKPELEIKPLQADFELDGQRSKFKMPKFGIKMPKVKGPELDLSLQKKKADVKLPEAKAEVKLPEAPEIDVKLGSIEVSVPEQKMEVERSEFEIKPLQTDIELDGQGSKFKMPKFGIKMPKMKGPQLDISLPKKDMHVTLPEGKAEVKLPDAPDVDVTLGSIDVSIPEQKLEVEKPELEIKPLQTDIELDGQRTKFKMPKFGIKMPKMKGPQLDISLPKKDMDITIPETKAEVKLSNAPEVDINLGSIDVSIQEQNLEVEKPELEIKPLQTDIELDGQGSKFKMPTFGIKMPNVKGPELDLSSQKKEVDVKLPEGKAEVKLPDAPDVDATLGSIDVLIPERKMEIEKPELEIKQAEFELDGQGGKFKMPKFGIKMPKVKGPELDSSLQKKDVTIPEAKAEVKLPEAPEVDITLGSIDVSIPDQKLEIEKPQLEITQAEVELDGQGSRFKMPKFGIKMPKMKGPQLDTSMSKKDMHVTLPEGKAELKFPNAPDVYVTLGNVDVSSPDHKLQIEKPELEIKQEEVEFKGQFKTPTIGMSMPEAKRPEIDFNISKKDVNIKVPEAKAEITLPDFELKEPSTEVELNAPEIEVQLGSVKGSPSKFKLPTFKFPKFGISTPAVDAEVPDKGIKVEATFPEVPKIDVNLGKAELLIPEGKLEVQKPEVEIKPLQTEVELDGQGNKFKMPKLGMSMPKVKGPEIDISISKKDADIKLPKVEGEVNLPDVELKEASAKVEVQAPEIEAQLGGMKGSPSKFKLPTFKFPKFGVAAPDVSAKVPDTDKDITVEIKVPDIPEIDVNLGKAEVLIPEGKLEVQKPEVEIKPLQTEVELDGKGSKFKMPKLGMSMPKVKGPDIDISLPKKDVDIKLPEAKAEVSLPDVEIKEPSAKVEVQAPEIEAQLGSMKGSPSKFKLPTFKLPKFGIAAPDVSAKVPDTDKDIKVEVKIPDVPEIDVNLGKAEVLIREGKLAVQKPEVEIKPLQTEVELDGQGSKFKMPKLGMSMPKVKGPDIDISLPMKDVDIKLPEAKAEVSLPDVEIKEPSAKVEVQAPEIEAQLGSMKGSQSKFKLPTFKLPKFGIASPDVSAKVPDTDKDIKVEVKIPDVPEIDVNLGKAEVLIREGKLEVQKPEVEIKPLQTEVELDGQGSKFKMPKLGMSMPKVKGPEIDISISKKDADIKLPEVKGEVSLPDVELKESSVKVEVQAPEIEAQLGSMKGSQSKFKLPTFKFPKFGVAAPDVSAKVPDTDKDIKVEAKIPEVPEIDVNLGKAEVLIPEGKLEVQKPEVEIKPLQTEVELEGQGSKFKMPKLGMSMPKVKGPEIDISISKKDADIKLPKVEGEVNLPDVELKEPSVKVEVQAPEIEAQLGGMKGSPSKFKLPTFKFPKFGVATPDVSARVPDTDKDIKVEVKVPDITEIDVNLGKAEVLIPEGKLEVQKPKVEIKPLQTEVELDGQGSTFRMPKLGMSMPKVKGPEIDISISKKDADIKLPKVEGEVNLPDIELKEPSVKVEVQAPEIEAQLGSMKGSQSKFKLPTFKFPKFGVAAPDVSAKVPDTDKDIKVEVKVPDIPEIDVNLGKAEVSIPEGKLEVQKPKVEIKPLQTEVELEGQGSKFKMPKLGMSMPKVKGPEIDISISKKDADIKLPKVEGEVNLPDVELKEPSAKVEVQAPEIEAQLGGMKGSQSKFKLPTFKFPKFGVAAPHDKDIKVEIKIPDVPEIDVNLGKAEVLIPEGKLEVQKPEVELKPLQTEVELDGQGSKFKMPKLGMSMPKVKGPEIDISISKKDADIKLPKVEGEVYLLDVELKEPSAKVEVQAPEIEAQLGSMKGSPSKFKLPTFKFPKFGVAAPDVSAKVPDTDKDIKVEVKIPDVPEIDVNLGKAELLIPEGKLEVQKPEVEIKPLQTEVELDGQGSKFKMPKLGMSMPKVKGPEIDISISKKDADIKLPKVEGEVNLPDVELKEASAKVEVQAPEIEAQLGGMKGSPSKFKLPTFKFPKFGVAAPDVSAKVPDTDKDIKVEIKVPEIPEIDVNLGKAEVLIPEGKLEVQKPEVEIKPLQTEVELDGKGSKFKMPKLGMSMPKVKGPEIDISISKKDADIKFPKVEGEVNLPDVELKEPSAKVEVQAPEIEAQLGSMKGSPSKFKLPTFKFPKFGVAAPDVSAKVPDTDKDIKVEIKIPDVPEIDVNLGKAEVLIPEGKLEVQKPKVQIKPLQTEVELDGKGSKFKMPKLGMSMPKVKGPEIDISISKKDADIKLPKVEGEVNLPDVELKEPSAKVEVQAPEIEAQLGGMKGSPSKFKLPTFKFPKFGHASSDVSGEVPDTDKDIKVNVKIPEVPEIDVNLGKAEVLIPEANMEVQIPEMEMNPLQTDGEHDGKGSKFKMPKFGIKKPKLKGRELDVSLPKKDIDVTLQEAEAEVSLPDAPEFDVTLGGIDIQIPEQKLEFEKPDLEIKPGQSEAELDGQGRTFKMPKLGMSMPKIKGPEIDISVSKKDADIKLPERKAEVDLSEPSAKIEVKAPEIEAQLGSVKESPSRFKLPTFKFPKFGIGSPNVSAEVPHTDEEIKIDGAQIHISAPHTTVDFPDVKAAVTLPGIEVKEPMGDTVIVQQPGIEVDAKVRKPRFSLPKISFSKPSVKATEVSHLDDFDVPLPEGNMDIVPPEVELKPTGADVELDGQEHKFKIPESGISVPKLKGPDIDLSLSTKDIGATLPKAEGKAETPEGPETDVSLSMKGVNIKLPEVKTEVTLPGVELEELQSSTLVLDAPTDETEAKMKRPNWTFPKFSFSKTSGKAPDVAVNVETLEAVTSPEVKAEIYLPEVEVKESSGIALIEESSKAEFDTNLKKSKFSLPKMSFSKSSVVTTKVSAELPQVDVSLKEGEVIVKQPEMEIKSPELESLQGSKFKIPKFGIALPKAKGPEVDLSTSQKDVDITLPDVKAEVKLPEVEVKESSASVEAEAKSKDVGGSPLKFKMPTLKMPKFGSATHDVTVEASDADKAEISSAKLEEDITVKIKGPSVDVTAVDSETPNTETDDTDHGSPSRFKLPSFKMPRLSFSKPKSEEENVPSEVNEDQLETAGETKSAKMTLTSFGEMIKNIDVEFDVPQPDNEKGENLETSEPSGDQLDAKEKDTNIKQVAAKSPEKTSWFKFPRFGLSSPSEPVKTFEKDEQREEKSPVGETGTEETSPTFSVQSSDGFADISSTVTSEHVGLSISSPTKVTVKYSDPNGATELEEIHSKVITSTTKTEMISIEPDLPEKITILSSGVSSSSEDTVKLESGKIHIISSNIQATPEAQHAKLFSAVQVQSAGGLSLESEAGEAASWTVEDSQSGRRTVFERHVVRETSSEISESKETIVITKQVTHIFDSSEPISGETASSIQRLRDTVHSEKMRFFDGAEK